MSEVGRLLPLFEGDKMNILFLDLETTGTNPDVHSIIQIGAALFVEGKKVDQFKINLAPRENSITDLGALRVNKNSLSALNSKNDRKTAFIKFIDWILSLNLKYEGQLIICGHNVHFDLSFIKSTLKEYNIEGWDSVVSYRIQDTNTIGRFLINNGLLHIPKSQKGGGLEKLALALGIEVRDRNLHDALEDVKLTAEVYYELSNFVRELSGRQNTTI